MTYPFLSSNADKNLRDTTRNQSFTYDALNRLTSAQTAGTDCSQKSANGTTKYWAAGYGYDAWGNLVSKTPMRCVAESLNAAADNQNRIHQQKGADFGYDAAGNMTFDPVTGNSYSFDAENRITGAGGYAYTYGANGNRVEKSNGTTGTIYWYTTLGIVAESDLSGNLTSEYVFFNGDRVARRDFPGNNVSYYFSDHLKTASVITDGAGNITEDEDFYPWGGEVQFVNHNPNHYKFTGKERDAETQLDYFGARYYGNWAGRFLTPDWAAKTVPVPYAKLNNPQTLNLYGYVLNNPLTNTDPDGHDLTVTGEKQKDYIKYAQKASGLTLAANKDGKISIIKSPKNLSGLGKAYANLINDKDHHVSLLAQGATPAALIGQFDGGGHQTLNFQNINALDGKGGFMGAAAVTHETFEAYESAKGETSFERAHAVGLSFEAKERVQEGAPSRTNNDSGSRIDGGFRLTLRYTGSSVSGDYHSATGVIDNITEQHQ